MLAGSASLATAAEPEFVVDVGGGYFDRWEAGAPVLGNCVDAAVMTLLANCSTGVDFMARGLTGDLHPGLYFVSNPLCVIGSDPLLTENYHQVQWTWHQVATHVGEPFTAGARV